MRRTLIVWALILGSFWTVYGIRYAVADGSGSAVSAPSADTLHDPTSAPSAAFDDLKAAKKAGWSIAAFAALLMAARLASKLGKNISWLSALGKGKVAVVLAAVGAIAASSYNLAVAGGSWTAIALAALVAGAHYLDATPKAEPEPTGN